MKTFWRSSFLTMILIAIDAVALSQVWLGAWTLRHHMDSWQLFDRAINPLSDYSNVLPFFLVAWLIILAVFRFYAHHERIASLNRLGPILGAVVWMVIIIAFYNWSHRANVPDLSRAVVAIFALGAFLWLFLSRTLFRYLKAKAIEGGHGRVRALVVGSGQLGRETMARVHAHPDIGFRIVGFISAEGAADGGEIEGYPILGGLDQLVAVIQRHRVEEVFLAIPDLSEDDIFAMVDRVHREAHIVCKVVANMLYVIANRSKVDEIVGLPVIAFRGREFLPVELMAKRAIDMVCGAVVGLLALPPALLFAALIRLDSPGPALFVHERVGRGGRRFRMIKFRTMRVEAEEYAEAPVDQTDGRVTRFGRFLRRTSLDEIPQLWNVLRGDMSLIGPRPEMPFIAETYNEWQKARLEVKPGLTGIWQVAGRKNLPLHFNLEYDFYYVKNQSLGLDLEILARTIPAVVLGRGAY